MGGEAFVTSGGQAKPVGRDAFILVGNFQDHCGGVNTGIEEGLVEVLVGTDVHRLCEKG